MKDIIHKIKLVSNEELPELKYVVTSLKGDARNQVATQSSLLADILLVEDVGSYMKENIVELEKDKVYEAFTIFLEDSVLNKEWQFLMNTTLHCIIEIHNFIHEDWVRLVLRRVHGLYIWIDKTYEITK